MGNNLFGVDIAGIIGGAMNSGLPVITLIKVTTGTRDPNDPTAGNRATEKSYKGRGFLDDYKDYQIDETTIRRGDRKILVTGSSLNGIVPSAGDSIIAEGITFSIINVKRDPAAATYTCQGRGQ